MRTRHCASALLLSGWLAGCDDPSGPSSRTLTLTPGNSIVLDAVGATIALSAAVRVDGSILNLVDIEFRSTDTAVARVSDDGVVAGAGNGTTLIIAQEVLGAADSVQVSVSQAVDSIDVRRPDSAAISSVAPGQMLPLTCVALDRNGFPIPGSPLVSSASGVVSGVDCASLLAQRSGYDTLTIASGQKVTLLPLVLAIQPSTSSPIGEFVTLDSFPFDYRIWAPSARLNSQDEVEVYVTGYQSVPDSNGVGPGALHRLVSSDGFSFAYDGIALNLLPPPCGLICTGIENIAIVPRADAPGWRMLFAAGSSGTYGWQVFSAISDDERNWVIEPGVRISNGGQVPPAPPMTPPWPVGEGMVVDQLPGGDWRMLVGGYEPFPGSASKFQVVEYRSPDQIAWTYQGARFTTSQMPPSAQRSVYSPTLVEFSPGLWRMFVTADDLNLSGGRSRIFTAISVDRTNWQFEMELVGGPGTNIYYSALVNNRLFFLRQDTGDLRRLAAVTVVMP
jgi:hypothetical protein